MSDVEAKTAIETPLQVIHAEEKAAMGTWFGCLLPEDFGDWRAEYAAARETVALIDKNYRVYLRFIGPDRVRYLNALLTNNIKDLAPGKGIISLFLNPQGKIQAEIETYAGAESLFCVSYSLIRETVVPVLDKFIIMDDVTLTDETKQHGTLALEGPATAGVVQKLTGVSLGSLSESSFLQTSVGGLSCRLIKRSPGGVSGAEFLAPSADLPQLWQLLREAAEQAGGRPMGYMALSALRLEQGIPWFGYDFGDKQIPHEAGLEHSHISYTKGCYTGQEIVERVRSRGQVNRMRLLLKFDTAEPPSAGTALIADEKEVGSVTRTAFSPALRTSIGMAYVRREKSDLGTQLQWSASGTATVIRAPLAATN